MIRFWLDPELVHDRVREPCDDADEDDERDTVADARVR